MTHPKYKIGSVLFEYDLDKNKYYGLIAIDHGMFLTLQELSKLGATKLEEPEVPENIQITDPWDTLPELIECDYKTTSEDRETISIAGRKFYKDDVEEALEDLEEVE